tara:strand:+ start:2607 stop:3362 length:756 start_codon:yes stop_codon:yes gene_type:complete
MVTTKLTGGLGNYLFQIGVASSLAFKNNDKAIFDFGSSVGQAHKNINKYSSNILRNIEIGLFTPEYTFNEAGDFTFCQIPYAKNLVLEGYFQSAKYLDREHILELYKIDDDTNEYIKSGYDLHSLKNSISIHVRRGDYIGRPRHPVQTMEYYNEAIKHFSNANFIVFSDDIEWCKENFKGDEFTFIHEDDYIELYLMSMCKHNIIANSSFSWWGSYLNQNKDKIVISPDNWFGVDGRLKTKNIYGEGWVVI